MLDIRDQIIERHQEFNKFLNSIDLGELKEKFSRHELKELQSTLYKIDLRSLKYEIGKVVDEMKKEEFPQLLGVHHYPVLNEIDFLSETEKVKLDEFLVSFHPGHEHLHGLWRAILDESKIELIKEFLIDKKIVEEVHFALCPHCQSNYISGRLNNKERAELEKMLKDEHGTRYMEIERIFEPVCMECVDDCDLELEYFNGKGVNYETQLLMIMERDTSLDNV